MTALAFVARRAVALALLLIVISFGVFSLLYLAPGSPEQVLLGVRPSTPATIAAIRAENHLDEPFLAQYGIWLQGAVTLDFGRSVRTGEPVMSAIASSYTTTLQLGLYAFLLATVSGLALGGLAAIRRRTTTDRVIVGAGVVAVSAPAFATGLLLIYVFSVLLGWFPPFGLGEGLGDRIWHLTLPAIALALTGMALVLKLSRAAMARSLESDYVTFARARGLAGRPLMSRYVLRNSTIPVVTASGIVLGSMITGAVLVENTFALPGLGSLLVESVGYKDLPMVQAIVIVTATAIFLVNLVTDLLYVLLDPRVRQGAVA